MAADQLGEKFYSSSTWCKPTGALTEFRQSTPMENTIFEEKGTLAGAPIWRQAWTEGPAASG